MIKPAIISALLACLVASGQGLAAAAGQQNMVLAEADRSAPRLNMSEAMELAQRQIGGRALTAQETRLEGRTVYRIKLLTRQGEVRIVHVDAETGKIE